MVRGPQSWHRYRLPFEVANGLHSLCPKQLVATGMHSAQEHDRRAQIDFNNERRNESHADVDLVGTHLWVKPAGWKINILDVAEALGLEQPFGHILRRDADALDLGKADRGRFRRGLLGKRLQRTDEARGTGRRQGREKVPASLYRHDESPSCSHPAFASAGTRRSAYSA